MTSAPRAVASPSAAAPPAWVERASFLGAPTVVVGSAVGPRVGDAKRMTREAGELAARLLQPAPSSVHVVNQVHGANLVRVEAGAQTAGAQLAGDADGLWTTSTGVCLVVRTADCAPVAIVGHRRGAAPALALVHSGWRGTLGNIVGAAVCALRAEGFATAEMQLWIGPMISAAAFEIGNDVREQFSARWPHWRECWEGRTMNLGEVIRRQAQAEGVDSGRIVDCGRCTFGEAPALPSHRREGPHRPTTLYTLGCVGPE